MTLVEEQESQQASTVAARKTKRHSSDTEQTELSTALSSKRQRTADNSTYVQVFHHSLSVVLSQESHLFSKDELSIFDTFRLLTATAQLLFARLYIRKHKWIRVDSINYEEIKDLDQVLLVLNQSQLIECYEGTAAIDELLATLTMDELRGLCHTKSDQRRCSTKQDMIRHLVKQTRTQTKLVFQSSAKQRPAQLSIDKGNGLDVLSRKSLKITGGLIRICAVALEAFGRLHTVRYRYVHTDHSTMLSSSLLAAFGLRRYPDYVVKRSCKVFMDRAALLAYEEAVIIEQQLHELISENTPAHLEAAWQLCQGIEVMWDLALVEAMVNNHYSDNNYFLARFSAGWIYTAVMEHGAELLGRLRRYEEEVVILRKLLDQRSYKLGSRGNWYERLALIHERYLKNKAKALAICIEGIEDPHVWMAAQQSLQHRIIRLQRDINVPVSERRCFEHLRTAAIPQIFIEGVRAKQGTSGAKAKYILSNDEEGTVEALALEYYVANGYQGVHSETSILTTLFALLFWDILFAEHEGVFEMPEQSAPLDLTTDAFYLGRREMIEKRLEQIELASNAATDDQEFCKPFYLDQLERIDDMEREHLTVCRGVSWEYTKEDLVDVAQCLGGSALAAICRLLAQEYGKRASGAPDLCLWKTSERSCKFVEVKGPGDRLSETQKIWCNVFLQHQIDVEVCHVRLNKATTKSTM